MASNSWWGQCAANGFAKKRPYQGVRIKFIAKLGQARIPLQVDVGFGDAVTPGPEIADFPTLLDFPTPHLEVYPKETVVAEKFEAMVRFGEANGRMKDFWDLNYIAEFEFDGELLQSALRATFENRRSHFPTVSPKALRDEIAENAMVATQWTAFINRNQSCDRTNFQRSSELRAFLELIIKAKAGKNPFSMSWQPGRGLS